MIPLDPETRASNSIIRHATIQFEQRLRMVMRKHGVKEHEYRTERERE